jgi:NitT/TauT family transport system substrate-binding protein
MMLGLIVLLQALTVAVSGPSTSPEYLPIRVAEAEGYFAREGLGVTLRTTRAEVGAAEALGQGQADLAATSFEALLRFGARAARPVPRLIFGLTAAPPVALVVAAQAGTAQSISTLAGLKLGLTAPGAPEHTWLIGLLARAGMAPTQIELVSLGNRGLQVALDAAEVHAGLIHEPAATRLLADGRVTLLADFRSPAAVAGALGAVTINAAIFIGSDRRIADRNLVAFTRALLAAEERIRTTSAAILAGRLSSRVRGPLEEFDARLTATRDIYLPRGLVTAEQLHQTLAMIEAHLPLPARLKLPRAEKLLHLEPLRRALTSQKPR